MRSHNNRNQHLFPGLGPNPEPHGSIFYSRPEWKPEPVYVLVSGVSTGIFRIIPWQGFGSRAGYFSGAGAGVRDAEIQLCAKFRVGAALHL